MNKQHFTNKDFVRALSESKLMASRCQSCDALHLPPRALCPKCHNDEMEWMEMSGRGRLVAFTTVNIGLSSMIAAGYDRKNPYCTGIVQLAEGPSISAQITGVDTSHPERITVGTEVTATFIVRGDEEDPQPSLVFMPV